MPNQLLDSYRTLAQSFDPVNYPKNTPKEKMSRQNRNVLFYELSSMQLSFRLVRNPSEEGCWTSQHDR